MKYHLITYGWPYELDCVPNGVRGRCRTGPCPMNKALTVALFVLVWTLVVASHVVATERGGNSSPRFSSVYTDLANDCKDAYEPEPNGQDVPGICTPVGKYRVRLAPTAVATGIVIEGTEDSTFLIAIAGYFDAEGLSKRKVEWRLAGGQPF